MKDDKLLRWVLALYTALVFLFVFAPIAASLVFSFNSDRFPTIPLGSFTTAWYAKAKTEMKTKGSTSIGGFVGRPAMT